MENYKVFVQLGKQKNPKWTSGKVLEFFHLINDYLVETHGQQLVLNHQNVKAYKKAKYNQEKRDFAEIIEFNEKNWDKLKNILSEAMKEFFPNEKININEEEKIIYAMQDQLSISCGIFEVEAFSFFQDVAEWSVVAYKPIPATRYEPEDVQEINLGKSANNISAAKIFIDSIWSLKCESYWENKSYDSLAKEESY